MSSSPITSFLAKASDGKFKLGNNPKSAVNDSTESAVPETISQFSATPKESSEVGHLSTEYISPERKALGSEGLNSSATTTATCALLPESGSTSKMRNFNCLAIGATKHGKSLFIKALHEFTNTPIPKSLEVGHGGASKTKNSTVYSIVVSNLKTGLVDGVPISKRLEDIVTNNFAAVHKKQLTTSGFDKDMFLSKKVLNYLNGLDGNDDDDKRQFSISSEKIEPFRLNIIDTPGLDDTEGFKDSTVDAYHMTDVLEKLQEFKEIHGIICTIGWDSGFPKSLLSVLQTYLVNFSELAKNFVVLHTKYKVRHLMEDAHQQDRTFIFGDLSSRVRELNEQLIKQNVAWPTTAIHIPIDSMKPKDEMKASSCFFYSFISDFLNSISSFQPTQLHRLSLQKPKDIAEIDKLVLARLLTKQEEINLQISSGNSQLFSNLSIEIADLKAETSTSQKKLVKLNTDERKEVAALSWSMDPSLYFTFPRYIQQFTVTNHDIVHVDKSASKTWGKECLLPRYYSVELLGTAFGGWHSVVRVFTTFKKFHEQEIDQLVALIAKNELLIDAKSAHQESISKDLEKSAQLQEELSVITTAIRILNAPSVDIGFFREVLPQYSQIAIAVKDAKPVSAHYSILVTAYIDCGKRLLNESHS